MSLYHGLDEGTSVYERKKCRKEKMVLDLNLKWLKNNSHSAKHQYLRNLRLTSLLNIIRKTFSSVVFSSFDVDVNYLYVIYEKNAHFFFNQKIGNKMKLEYKIIN